MSLEIKGKNRPLEKPWLCGCINWRSWLQPPPYRPVKCKHPAPLAAPMTAQHSTQRASVLCGAGAPVAQNMLWWALALLQCTFLAVRWRNKKRLQTGPCWTSYNSSSFLVQKGWLFLSAVHLRSCLTSFCLGWSERSKVSHLLNSC